MKQTYKINVSKSYENPNFSKLKDQIIKQQPIQISKLSNMPKQQQIQSQQSQLYKPPTPQPQHKSSFIKIENKRPTSQGTIKPALNSTSNRLKEKLPPNKPEKPQDLKKSVKNQTQDTKEITFGKGSNMDFSKQSFGKSFNRFNNGLLLQSMKLTKEQIEENNQFLNRDMKEQDEEEDDDEEDLYFNRKKQSISTQKSEISQTQIVKSTQQLQYQQPIQYQQQYQPSIQQQQQQYQQPIQYQQQYQQPIQYQQQYQQPIQQYQQQYYQPQPIQQQQQQLYQPQIQQQTQQKQQISQKQQLKSNIENYKPITPPNKNNNSNNGTSMIKRSPSFTPIPTKSKVVQIQNSNSNNVTIKRPLSSKPYSNKQENVVSSKPQSAISVNKSLNKSITPKHIPTKSVQKQLNPQLQKTAKFKQI